MSGKTVCHGIEKDGSLAVFYDPPLALKGVYHGEYVVTVHPLGVQLSRGYPGAYPREDAERHRLARGLTAHAVMIVDKIEDDRQAAVIRSLPQLCELILRREIERFPNRTAAERRVADVANDQSGQTVDALIESAARRDTGAAAHDGVVRVDAERGEKHMHRIAQAACKAVLPSKQLGDEPV
jgi:hypothetical protein